mgnify:CR=1 FL=1
MKNSYLDELEILHLKQNSPAIIFLHGGPGVFGYMEPLCRMLSPHCNAVTYNQRGSKQAPSIAIEIKDHLNDLENVVSRYTTDTQPILVGHSWGAMLAILFAGRFSSLIQKLVLIGCGPLTPIQNREFSEALTSRFGKEKKYYDDLWSSVEEESNPAKQQELANIYINKIVKFYQCDPNSAKDVPPLHWDYQASINTMNQMDDAISKSEYEKSLTQIGVPISVIQGEGDPVAPVSIFSLIKTHQPTALTFEIKNAGHYPWAGASKEDFIQILLQEIQ